LSQYFFTHTLSCAGLLALISDDHTHASEGTARRNAAQLAALSLT